MLGPEALGRYYFAAALASFATLVAGLGLPVYGAREVAKRRDDPAALERLHGELFALNLLATFAVLAAYAGIALCLPAFAGHGRLLALLGIGVAANVFSVEYLFLGLEAFPNLAWRALATKTVSLAALFACVRGPEHLYWFAAIGVAASSGNGLLGFLSAWRRVRLRPAFAGLRAHAAPLAVTAGNLALVCVYNNLDSVFLGMLTGTGAVSLYNAGVRFDRMVVLMISSAGIVLAPRMAFLFQSDKGEETRRLAGKSLSVMCFLACPAAAFVLAAAPELTALVFGTEFSGAAASMRICAPIILINGFTNFLGLQILFPRGEERLMLFAVGAAAVVDAALIRLLAPHMAQEGAAIALLAAESTVLAVQGWAYRRRHAHTAEIGKNAWRYFLAAPAAAAAVLAGRAVSGQPALALAAALAIGTPAYLGALFALQDPVAKELLARARQALGLSGNGTA